MRNKTIKIITLGVIIILVSVIVFPLLLEKNDEKIIENTERIIYVDDDGEGNYLAIQDAIDNAIDYDTIFVHNGIYNETIIIDKKIKIQGESRDKTIIDGMYNKKIVSILSDNVVFTGFTIKNSDGFRGDTGIFIQSNNNTISDCIIFRTRTGMIIDNSQNQEISGCLFHTNGEGIWAKNSRDISIHDSNFCYSGIGVNLYKTENIVFENIYAHENGISFFINTSSNVEMNHCASCDNNDNAGGVYFYNSYNIDVENCNAIHSGSGFKIVNSKNVYFNKCDMRYNTHFTIWVHENSENIHINQCNLIDNLRHGIDITDSQCIITDSNLYGNLIDSVLPINSQVSAQNNYWESKFGPAFSKGFRIADKLFTRDFGKIKYFPWSTKEFENAGSDWIVEQTFEKTIIHGYGDSQIVLKGVDTDSDGIPDWWEEEFNYSPITWDDHANLDSDEDALNNFEECYAYSLGARPDQKDLFIEFDHTKSKSQSGTNILPKEYVDQMVERFAEHDIVLHVDQGELGGGEEIPYITNFNFDELVDLYWDYFLHNNLNNPRKNIFHYGLICDEGPGNGFAFVGWAHLNSFCISGDILYGKHSFYTRDWLITCGSMHETGHTLGLIADDFGGNDNHASIKPKYSDFWYYRNYKSCMNYRYTYSILDFSDGDNGMIDYNDWEGMEFDFFKNTHFEWPKQ